MSGPESFSAPESANQGGTAESYRLFQERMKAAAAQIQAIRAGEQKQKKKEDDLARILTEFIKSTRASAHNDLLLEYISKLLAINLPAIFIISLIIINFPELQKQSGLLLIDYSGSDQTAMAPQSTLPDLYFENATLPLEVKIAIDSWLSEISRTVNANPQKILDHALRLDGKLKEEVIDLASHSLNTYLSVKKLDFNPETARKFMEFCLSGIINGVTNGARTHDLRDHNPTL